MLSNKSIVKLYFINIVIVLLIVLVQLLLGVETSDIKEEYANSSFFEELLLGIIFAPIIEEFAFRYPLIDSKSKWLYVSLVWGILFSLINNSEQIFVPIIMITINFFIFIDFFLRKKQKVNIYLAILSALLFSLIHLSNYEMDFFKEKTTLSLVFQFLPQFIGGGILTYLRLNGVHFYKIILFHSAYNLFFLLMELFNF